ncbi:MAG: T9SS type A sorting domain-containing protein [Bacteroidota bacterium]
MKQSSASISKLFIAFIFAGLIIFPAMAQAQDLTINNDITISDVDPPEEVDNLIYNNSSKLTITGTLIVNGDFDMDKNGASLELGVNARLIVYGDFIAHNQVNITLQKDSYLFVYGNFSKGGAANQDVVIIDNAKIYILGNGDNWGDNLTSCGGNYDGTTNHVDDTCDFGNEEDFENNQGEFPDDLVEQLNCYDLSAISDEVACEGSSATFSVSSIPDVDYQWQEKIGEADWTDVGINSHIYSIENTSLADSGNLYRVIVQPTDPANSSCKISISRKVTLVVETAGIWTGEIDTDWNNEENWSCKRIPDLQIDVIIPAGLQNYPEIKVGANALSNDLTIETGASVLVDNNWLRIAGSLMNSQNLNVETGSISFEGTAAQTIPAAAFKNNRIQNLNINNPLGVISEAIIEVTGMLKVETGNFETGNQLTLISDATQTALIDGSGTGQVIGNVTMQRYLDNSFGYKYFATPFNASKVGDFSDIDLAETFPNFYRYDENRKININDTLRDATGWEAYTTAEGALNVMEGYALNFGASTNPLTVSLTGEVNNGDYSQVLENNNGEYTKGFHLVGNPYPSPIDWNASGWTKTNIDNQIHFFTAGIDNRYTGTYESFVNGVAQNGGSATSIIPSMQGFFVKVSDSDTDTYPVTGTLGINNTTRVNNFTQEFYRNQEHAPKSLIRLDASFKGESGKDGMVIYFENQASQDFESQLDAHKLMNTDVNVPNLYSLSPDRQQLSINAVARPEDKKETIPLGITTEKGGTMSISLKDLENLPYDFTVFLKDKEKNKTVDLRKQAYSFEVKKGENNSRFELLFSNEFILTKEDLDDEFFSVFSSDGKMQVELNLEEEKEGVLRLSTVTGQLLETKAGRGKEQVSFDGISSSGVYFVILEKDGKRYTKKVLIRK